MTRWTRNYWTVLGSSAVAIAMPLVVTAKAVAHEGHPHQQDTEAANEPSATPHPESVNTPATDRPLESHESPVETTSETPTAPATVAQARVTEGFSMGLGESLLGLIIAGPFLLLTLKRRLQS